MSVFDFGLRGYQPQWLSGIGAIRAAHADALRSLVGLTLSASWLVWDLDDDEWFADCPVLLDFGGTQIEINHHKFDDFSITWNEIDPLAPVGWPGTDPEFQLAWRRDAVPELFALHGQQVASVELLEWAGSDVASGMVAVSFVLGDGRVSIYNAMDENGLAFTPPDSDYRIHRL